ncbi:MAG: glycosyltransferase [Tateyamaria sp.]|uniref:glycosyltransferase family protein n=1 Tax=Tateyamaria sp. TaxID=1929288 RepID=UPI00327148CE
MKVMIVVTHLLGTGHLARALTIGRAFAEAGDQVSVVSGGGAVSHFDTTGVNLHQLPPVQSNGTEFTTLLCKDGTQAGPAHLQKRQDRLMELLIDIAPDVLITELFPFGRRILKEEFATLLQAARAMSPRPLVLSSIRDILAPPSKPSKAAYADEMVTNFYDGVLVHSDADVVPLDLSWPVSTALAPCLHYTGFVAPAPPDETPAMRRGIVVSAGGGTVGDKVFEAAINAANLAPDIPWLLLVSGEDSRRIALNAKAPSHVRIEAPRPDFRALLEKTATSVSMCGYNTALDVLQTGVPAVLVPFDDGGEVEQGLRAAALSTQNGIAILRQDALSGTSLVDAIADVQAANKRPPRIAGMDGAARTVEIVRDLHRRSLQ